MMTLFDPIRLGAIEAPNRIFMAPMTPRVMEACTDPTLPLDAKMVSSAVDFVEAQSPSE